MLNRERIKTAIAKHEEILRTLIAADKLLSSPKKWTKGAYARNANGDSYGAHGSNAACYCAIGAIMHVSVSTFYEEHARAMLYQGMTKPQRIKARASIEDYNDLPSTDFWKMKRVFKRAIVRTRDRLAKLRKADYDYQRKA